METSGSGTGRDRRWMISFAAVVFALAAAGLAAWMLAGGEGTPDRGSTGRTIAVLPFQVLGERRGDDFGAGIHAGLLTRLAGSPASA